MGKRKDPVDEEHIRKKIRRLEKKLERVQDTSTSSSLQASTTAQEQAPPPLMQSEHALAQTDEDLDIVPEDDELPEEFLLALGNEGQEKTEIGEAIRPELATRWTKIMGSGLQKEAIENIVKKYPTPKNFNSGNAPLMNPEIQASVSELTLKRDRRITSRQNLTGKAMSCLGKSLTNLMKGNINTRTLIEEINDAAKLLAEIFHQDSSSRKFFALAGANQTVKEAVKDAMPDEFLFGKDCGEKIKAAQMIKKASTQIKEQAPKLPQKINHAPVKKQVNWRGPPQQHQRARGGQRAQHQSRQYSFNQNQTRDQRRQKYRRMPNHRMPNHRR
ncbi:hypothetical protein MSG28_011008 [Choristoneura fumiferana]|uniref:Uncharacterized protein n=3 Tax=Choristoneura fumiferana TaxID=7141 RepID=A0ACC0KQJ6_CHOFU|nr:hypothetical protein MSG28_011008 [Choristoneura fumiferana]KAI8438535.1 hypothetical protein MSG28_011008 [Choristoneura fumiferana]